MLVVGGYDRDGPRPEDLSAIRLASAEVYDPTIGTWSLTGSLRTARAGHTATLLPDGRVLVVGGGGEDNLLEGGPRSATAELYDPGTGEWTATGKMTEARNYFTATLLPNGSVLVAGGGANYLEAELYDPATGTWMTTGSMAEGRKAHSATLLLDGTVLVAGGCACSEPAPTASAERYDPITGEWTATGRMSAGRMGHTAVLLADGAVLVVAAGANLRDQPALAEHYDPGTGTWTPTSSFAQGRAGPSVTALADGRLLVSGGHELESGFVSEPTTLDSAELYDPATGRWSATASLGKARAGHTAILLADSRVLVAGGADGPDAMSAELFDPGSGS